MSQISCEDFVNMDGDRFSCYEKGVYLQMDRVRQHLRIDEIHRQGITGKDIGICILDTGAYPHNDYNNQICGFVDLLNGKRYAYDDNGHGTHVAGLIAGNGALSKGKYCGIAPGARLMILKCLDHRGKGKLSHTLRAFEMIEKYQKKMNLRVVNISLGTVYEEHDKECEALQAAVEKLWKSGLVVVSAAGNMGPERQSITVPGCVKSIITVGAWDDERKHHIYGSPKQHYSGRGPTSTCIMKPEIVAPGTGIISCAKGRDPYRMQSGTSMATPIVTGVIALLLEKYPFLTNKEVKKRIYETAKDLGMEKNHQGWGEINPTALLSTDEY